MYMQCTVPHYLGGYPSNVPFVFSPDLNMLSCATAELTGCARLSTFAVRTEQSCLQPHYRGQLVAQGFAVRSTHVHAFQELGDGSAYKRLPTSNPWLFL